MRESSVQTTPIHSPFKSSKKSQQQNNSNGDYRTIVHVYDSPQRAPDILNVYNQPSAGSSSNPLSRTRPEVPGQARGDVPDSISSKATSTYSKLPPQRKPSSSSLVSKPSSSMLLSKLNGAQLHPISDEEASSSQGSSNQRIPSDNSYESYQAKALNAIKALDEVVANEPSGSLGDGDNMSPGAPPPPPPPPLPSIPPPPPPPPLGSGGMTPQQQAQMNVKRINWEKIDRPEAHSIWAKVSGLAFWTQVFIRK